MLNRQNEGCNGTLTEIGGYFGLDLPCYADIYPEALKFQSGRAAIRAVLECAGIERVMLPAYVCDSVIKAVVDSGAAVEIYALDESLYPKDLPRRLPERCVLLYVNYFGLCQKNISRLLVDMPGDRLIIDNSQALFSAHDNVLATVYSPRKFAGVPDGGLLMVSPSLNFVLPAEEDKASIERMRALLVRMAYSAREGYTDFQQIAISLKDTTPLVMSRLTQRLMKSIPWDQLVERRRANFLVLAKKLDLINDMHWEMGELDVPMCYPLTLRGCEIEKIKAELVARNIFVPVYWQDALPRISSDSIEAALTNETFFLPIDQRLECAQVEGLGDLILELTGKS
jgi:hypothetical protein